MGTRFFNEPDLSRMGAVKSFFEAFAYRTIAYNLEHVVSLIFFDDKIEVQCDFTEAIFDFNRLISGAQARGSTKLYDSIVLAANNLILFSKKYPDCKLRILALTDGEDNSSSNGYIEAARILINNRIIIDSFAVGSGCDGLKNITLASGGKCYLTRSLEESLKLFEQETVLSVRVRSH
jgi:Mg-chelatase subunit ChlD